MLALSLSCAHARVYTVYVHYALALALAVGRVAQCHGVIALFTFINLFNIHIQYFKNFINVYLFGFGFGFVDYVCMYYFCLLFLFFFIIHNPGHQTSSGNVALQGSLMPRSQIGRCTVDGRCRWRWWMVRNTPTKTATGKWQYNGRF